MDTAVSNGIGALIDRAVSIYSPTPSAIITKPFLTNIIELSDNFKIRDEKSVKRVVSGLIKLLFPDGTFNTQELKTITDIAVDYRQRVRDWLHKTAPGEFPKEKLSVQVKP